MTILLALLGFAPAADQQRIPPVLAWLTLGAGAYFIGWVLDVIAWLIGSTLSPYLRVPGVICTALVVQGFVRLLLFRDNLSWSGWLRERIK
jgi:nucleoside permease NupC